MPTYTLRNKVTEELFDVFCQYAELQEKIAADPNLSQVLSTVGFLYNAGNADLRVDNGFREVMSKIKDTHKINNMRDY